MADHGVPISPAVRKTRPEPLESADPLCLSGGTLPPLRAETSLARGSRTHASDPTAALIDRCRSYVKQRIGAVPVIGVGVLLVLMVLFERDS